MALCCGVVRKWTVRHEEFAGGMGVDGGGAGIDPAERGYGRWQNAI